MAERKTIGDAMTPQHRAFIQGSVGKESKAPAAPPQREAAKTIELNRAQSNNEAEAIPSRRRSRGRARDSQPQASEILDQVLVPVTIRLPHRTAQALKRAYLEQKLKHAKPDTIQDIGEEALANWLIEAGYLD